VPECVKIDATSRDTMRWLPTTCAYRRLAEGKELEWWHPLVSGDPCTVRRAGISVGGRVLSEQSLAPNELPSRVIRWIRTRRPRHAKRSR
jgi:uncharacterized cysteine cluster protein YcgN (CxxCxxCC family)